MKYSHERLVYVLDSVDMNLAAFMIIHCAVQEAALIFVSRPPEHSHCPVKENVDDFMPSVPRV